MKKILIIIIITMLLIVTGSIPAYAEGCSKYITVTHIFNSHHSGLKDVQFTYKLVALSPGAPMPESNRGDEYSWKASQNETRDIGPFVYTTPGNYSYEIYQHIGEEKPGYTYDKNKYTILHHVDKYMNVTTTIQDQLGGAKIEALVFENTFGFLLELGPAADPPIRKSITGNPPRNGVFTFILKAEKPSYPMPDGLTGGSKTISIVGAGESEFGTWDYENEGIYKYTISEVNDGQSGYIYDNTEYTITDNVVKNENGMLELFRSITNNNGGQVDSCNFTNVYSPKGLVTEGSLFKGIAARTSDTMNTALYTVLICLAAFLTYFIIFPAGKRKHL